MTVKRLPVKNDSRIQFSAPALNAIWLRFLPGRALSASPATGLTVLVDGRYASLALAGEQPASTTILTIEGEDAAQHILASAGGVGKEPSSTRDNVVIWLQFRTFC